MWGASVNRNRQTLPVIIFTLALVAPSLLRGPVAAEETATDPPERKVTPEDREHWSYQPIRNPKPPSVKNEAWIRTPIDRFILARLEAEGLSPAPSALPRDLQRRLYLDLIGLPPTIAEQDAFLTDPTAENLDREAAKLLKRTGYGERWSRHWLDLVRYADTNGYERDGDKPAGWRYRDWVIDSLNNDKPYDRFVLEQLAGDELDDASTETVLATGFYRLGPWDDEPAEPAQDLHDQRDDMIRTISQVFVGLTLGCARCHDHKFDALSMHDYYRMSAILAPLERPQDGRSELARPAGSLAQRKKLEERNRRISEPKSRITAAYAAARTRVFADEKSGLSADIVAAFRTAADKRNDDQKKLVEQNQKQLGEKTAAALSDAEEKMIAEADRAIAKLRKETPDLPDGYFLFEPDGAPPTTNLLLRGRAATPGPVVQPGLPVLLVDQQPEFEKTAEETTGRRLALARWILEPKNPLTARVIVNRVWQYHFGEGLVRTPSDFGILGLEPTHPELLDWLAHWFVHEADWSLKKLHTLIIRSQTYRMSKSLRPDAEEQDPLNLLLWRFPYRRLQVEALRDSMLAASGKLNRKMYGPGTYLHIPPQALEGHADRASIWKPFDEQEASRRTVYALVKRSLLVPMLEVLDLCDTTRSTDVRNITSVPTQALTLFNGDFVNRQAAHLAGRAVREAGTDQKKQITQIWRLALCRPPEPEELSAIDAWLTEEAARGKDTKRDKARRLALIQLCRVVLNLNEFAYPN
jgi:hypothetical protein